MSNEQFELNFEGSPFETMSMEELMAEYKKHIGVSYRHDLTRSELVRVLESDPEIEISRLREIDSAGDRDDINDTYRR